MAFIDNLMLVPSASRFVRTLRDDLSKRRSILLLLPTSISDIDIWITLTKEISGDFEVDSIDLTETGETNPLATLGEMLQLQRGIDIHLRTLSDLIQCNELPDVLLLNGMDDLTSAAQKSWLNAIIQWSRVAQQRRDRGYTPMAFFLPVHAERLLPALPEPDVFLGIRRWWGIPSLIDMRMLCRWHHSGTETHLLSQWREHLLPMLANSDSALAEFLWDKLEYSSDTLLFTLKQFARERGWTPDCLLEWGVGKYLEATRHTYAPAHGSPEKKWMPLWANDVLSYTPEQGWELHTAALAMLDVSGKVLHRLWRGQASLLLPRMDAVRLQVCSHLTETYGPEWPLWQEVKEERERQAMMADSLTCGLGHLEKVLRCCSMLNAEYRLRALVYEAMYIRNEIAHYRTVNFEDFRRFEEVSRSI